MVILVEGDCDEVGRDSKFVGGDSLDVSGCCNEGAELTIRGASIAQIIRANMARIESKKAINKELKFSVAFEHLNTLKQLFYQNVGFSRMGGRIFECPKPATNCIVDFHLDVQRENISRNMHLLTNETEYVEANVEVETVKEIVEVVEDDDQLILSFPATFLCHGLNIQFGSIRYYDDTKSELKTSNFETEPECGANINNYENDKNVTCCEGVDELDDGQGTCESVDESDDSQGTCEGVDELNEGQGTCERVDELDDDQGTCEGVDELDDGQWTCEGVDELDDGQGTCEGVDELNDDQGTCEGVDELDDDQGDGHDAGVPVNVQTEEETELPSYHHQGEIPKYVDEVLNEQIRNAQLQLAEKRMCIDKISAELLMKRENIMLYNNTLKAKNLELRDANQLVKSKSQQIEQTKGMINKVKNAIAVKDIDSKIYKAELMIKCGNVCLKDEKQLGDEIKQMKSKRSQLAVNMGSPDEFRHLLERKNQTEKRLKNLNMDLNTLKYKVSKAQVACDQIRKKYIEELDMERKLQVQFIAADKSQQEAHEHLDSLKSLLNDKVEIFMDIWNSSEEFRKDCISRNNLVATPKAHDEPSSVFLDDTNETVPSNSAPTPDEKVKSVEEDSEDQVKEDVTGEFEQMMKNEEPAEIVDIEEKEKIDELNKEEIEAKLEENMEENEANEWKKQDAEMAQTLAEMQQARKAAKKKEKARLKRLRNKERKRAKGVDATSSSVDDGFVAESNEEPQELPALKKFFTKHLKPIFTLPPMPTVEAYIKENWCRRWVNDKKSYLSPFI